MCGSENPEDTKFCKICGSLLKSKNYNEIQFDFNKKFILKLQNKIMLNLMKKAYLKLNIKIKVNPIILVQ